MANKKTRALRRAEYLRQKEAMNAQAREAMATQPALQHELERKQSNMSGGEVRQQIQLIPLAHIVTEEYQRALNMRNVAGIVRHFDPAKLGVLVVSHREDGTYSVLDGQHRLAALRRLGYLACGYTDLRRGIDGLAAIVEQQFKLDPCANALFLFCGKR